jgi:hypothetical protein
LQTIFLAITAGPIAKKIVTTGYSDGMKITAKTATELYLGKSSARIATCIECGREFDMRDEDDANDYWYGHDCEEQ